MTTLSDDALQTLQREIQGLLGRCLLRLQQYERLIKAIVAHHEIAGPPHALEAIRVARVNETARKTLGTLVGDPSDRMLSPTKSARHSRLRPILLRRPTPSAFGRIWAYQTRISPGQKMILKNWCCCGTIWFTISSTSTTSGAWTGAVMRTLRWSPPTVASANTSKNSADGQTIWNNVGVSPQRLSSRMSFATWSSMALLRMARWIGLPQASCELCGKPLLSWLSMGGYPSRRLVDGFPSGSRNNYPQSMDAAVGGRSCMSRRPSRFDTLRGMGSALLIIV